jgi:TonB family protein
MIVAIVALLAAGASPQAADDARGLLQRVADAARATKSWRIEGEIVTARKTQSGVNTSAQPFQLHSRLGEMRFEVGGFDATTIFRNGPTLWQYRAATNSYTRRDDMTGPYRTGVLGWEILAPELMPTAAMAGRDEVQFEGRTQVCELVRAELNGARRTLCIDRSRLLILRDRDETVAAGDGGGQAPQAVRTVIYRRIDRDIPLEESLFQLPAGAVERQTYDARKLPPGVTAPKLILKTEPTYTPEARAARFQGTVALSIEIGSDGVPRNVTVVRGVGLGLDEKAVETAQQWRFTPGEKDGKPVTVRAMVEMNFRLMRPPQ